MCTYILVVPASCASLTINRSKRAAELRTKLYIVVALALAVLILNESTG